MFSDEIRQSESFGSLLLQSVRRVLGALACFLATAAKRRGDQAERLTALTLLGSVALLATGVTVAAQTSVPAAVALCLLGATGMLISGYAGTRLDGGKAKRRMTIDLQVVRRGD